MTASGAVAADDVDTGRYRMTVRHGRLELSHVSSPTWDAPSVFSLRGDRIFLRSSDGLAVYRWNLFRDTLTLRFVPGREEGAPNLTFAPWHRTGA